MNKTEKETLFSAQGTLDYAKHLLEKAFGNIENPVGFFKSEEDMNEYRENGGHYPYMYGALSFYVKATLEEVKKLEAKLEKLNK